MYLIGTIVKPQGIKGEVKVKPVSPEPDRFYDLEEIFIEFADMQPFPIERVRIGKGFVFLKLANINSRNDAESLRGKDILISKDKLINLADDEYFVHDLIGCQVVSDNGLVIGEVEDIMQNSSNDIYLVRDHHGNEHLVPAINDVIRKVDIEKKQIIIHVLDGLFE